MRYPYEVNPKELSVELLSWWAKNKRNFPWRETRDPYKILISEVLLHRTRAEQVVPVYKQFVNKFPTIGDLSAAKLDEISEILKPLGLHWRTKLLSQAVNLIMKEYGGRIPSTKAELELLPGIGPYISSAIMCFAFGYTEPILDTNTVRIIGRVLGVKITDQSRRSKLFQELSESTLDKKNPREFNYALIDLGALACIPKEPLCSICPLNCMCDYGLHRLGRNLPSL
jgi:A/G-specific adenine glycosylase